MEHSTVKNHSNILNDIASGVISTLLYFDIFKYPLTAEEIAAYCHYVKADAEEISGALGWLVEKKLVNEKEGYFFIDDDHSLIQRRRDGNRMAETYLTHAKR